MISIEKFRYLSVLTSTRYLIRRNLVHFIEQHAASTAHGTVVDIGGGTSPYRHLFVGAQRYVAVDVENRSGDNNVVIADVNMAIPLADNFADTVVCTEVIEHLHNPQQAINEMYRILKPEGVLLLTTPFTWPLHEVPHDYFRYTTFGVNTLLYKSGFRHIETKESNGYWYTMCQLALVRLRRRFWMPVVIIINACGFLIARQERNRIFPLSVLARAVK